MCEACCLHHFVSAVDKGQACFSPQTDVSTVASGHVISERVNLQRTVVLSLLFVAAGEI